jgi:hypothetical protein
VLSLLVVPISDYVDREIGLSGLWLLVGAVILAGLCRGLSQPALFGEAANTHYKCVQVIALVPNFSSCAWLNGRTEQTHLLHSCHSLHIRP